MTEREKTGCFAWCVRLRQACNKRWARSMNRLRRLFHARRGQRVDPEMVLDETGARDMVLSKTYIDIPDIFAAKVTGTDDTVCNGTFSSKDFDRQVGEYVARILQVATDILVSKAQLRDNNHSIKIETDDNVSMTSSVISQIADIAVTESLSTVAMETDINQSAARVNRLMAVFIGAHRIVSADRKNDCLKASQ